MTYRNTQTRDRIIRIAAGLFGSHGWQATTLDDILSAAGITKGAFYHYFTGKQALCEASINQAVSEVQWLIRSIDFQQSARNSSDSISLWIEAFNRSEQRTWFRFLVRLSSDSTESYPSIHARLGHFWNEFHRDLLSLCSHNDKTENPIGTKDLIFRMAGSIVLERYLSEE
ncbi:MAG: TetR/AcrR family transcriptional regulator [Phycisphaerae bacterium]|nr:TetR/AcrR family transcriptional regulator [Phycisphaerae bacterium]